MSVTQTLATVSLTTATTEMAGGIALAEILVAIGIFVGILVVALIGYLGAPRLRRRIPVTYAPLPPHGQQKKEPQFRKAPPSEGDNPADTPAAPQPASEQQELGIDFTPPQLPDLDPALTPSLNFCYAIRLYGEKAVDIGTIRQFENHLKQYHIRVYQMLGFDENLNAWKTSYTAPARYWLVALPLADRGGKLDETRINLLEEETLRFGEKWQLRPLFPPLGSTLERIRIVDDFCNKVDLMVEIRLNPSSEQDANRVHEILSLNRMSPEKEGRYLCRRESEVLFSAQCNPGAGGRIASILFALDSPKVSRPIPAFDEMIERVRRIASALQANLTDPQGRGIDEERITLIRGELSSVVRRMEENQISPGGSLAHLLFS